MWGAEPATVTSWSGQWWNPFSWRWVTVQSSEWSQADIDLLVAYSQKEPVNALGILMSEATDPANQFRFNVPDMPSIDWSEKAWRDQQDKYYEANKGKSRNGHIWRLPTLKG